MNLINNISEYPVNYREIERLILNVGLNYTEPDYLEDLKRKYQIKEINISVLEESILAILFYVNGTEEKRLISTPSLKRN